MSQKNDVQGAHGSTPFLHRDVLKAAAILVVLKIEGSNVQVLLTQDIERLVSSVMNEQPPVVAPPRPVARGLDDHLADYRRERLGVGRSTGYVDEVCTYVSKASHRAAWALLTDATEDSALLYLMGLTDHYGEAGSPKYKNNVRGYLSAFFGWAVRKGRLDRNPIQGIDKFQDNRGEQIATPTPEQIAALINCVEKRKGGKKAGAIYRLVAFTGLRREEIELLEVRNFIDKTDTPHLYLTPAQQKGKHTERIPLVSPAVVDDLRARIKDKIPTARIFGRSPRPEVVKRDYVRAGMGRIEVSKDTGKKQFIAEDDQGRRFVLHSLRHALGTTLAVLGIAPKTIQTILRHRDLRMTQRYIDTTQLSTAGGLMEVARIISPFLVTTAI